MTDNTPTPSEGASDMVDVTQEDREAAADYGDRMDWELKNVRAVREGHRDKTDIVQAFACHRIAALATLPAAAPAGGHPDLVGHTADAVRDACRVWLGVIVSFDDSRGIADAILQRQQKWNREYAALAPPKDAPGDVAGLIEVCRTLASYIEMNELDERGRTNDDAIEVPVGLLRQARAAYLAQPPAEQSRGGKIEKAAEIAASLSDFERGLMLRFEPDQEVTRPSGRLAELGLFEKVGYEPRWGGIDLYRATDLGKQVYAALTPTAPPPESAGKDAGE